jgi:hypothetical protein
VYGGESEAVVSGAIDGDVVEKDGLQFVHGPGSEEDPGEEGVEEEEEGVGDAGGDGVVAFAALGGWLDWGGEGGRHRSYGGADGGTGGLRG